MGRFLSNSDLFGTEQLKESAIMDYAQVLLEAIDDVVLKKKAVF